MRQKVGKRVGQLSQAGSWKRWALESLHPGSALELLYGHGQGLPFSVLPFRSSLAVLLAGWVTVGKLILPGLNLPYLPNGLHP